MAAIAFAIPVATKLVADGIRGVSPTTVEAARSPGITTWQMITKVQLPMARAALVLATNQGLLYVLSMVVIGGLVGARQPRLLVVAGFSQSQLFGKGLAAGIAITALGRHARPDRPVRRGPLRPGADQPADDPARGVEQMKGRNAWHEELAGSRWPRSPPSRRWCWPAAAAATSRTRQRRRPGGKDCGDLNIAVNPWVGYEADAHVVGYVAETSSAARSSYQDVKEEVAWQGLANGRSTRSSRTGATPDLVQEVHRPSRRPSRTPGRPATTGIIGWYVPPWMAEKYPDITDWKNLNKYADMFKTSESGGKGQLLDGDPSFVTNDEALVKNLKLNYKVVYAGSEAALIQAFRQAEKNKKPLIGYFYEPQWFLSEVPLVKVNLPPYKDGCDADPAKVACDYPPYT